MGVLQGRVAIVTGAGAGLGLAIARELAAEGCDIAIAERDAPAGERAADELRGLGVQARSYPVDVSIASEVDTLFAAAPRELGRLDIVVNNAGVSHVGPTIAETTDEAWAESVGVMQTGVFFCLRAAARHLLPQGSGCVVNIASIRGFSPNPGRVAYCATKAAVLMMTRVAAGEWAGRGVRVNAIAPGIQRTPMWDQDVARGAIDEPFYLRTVPMGRIGDPREVGRLAVYLCSDDAAYVTGGCFTIDGGLTAIPAG
jgi:NAD(P)-dependent dehydrogenase (short-subunit alcohol dehydrogenase family)